MKLLYVTNAAHGSGGLERVLAVKTNYLVEKLNYEIHILMLNGDNQNLFYEFNIKIKFHNVKTKGNFIQYFSQYKKGIQKIIATVKPAVISVCDDGLKGTLFSIIFGKKIPVIYERHVSKEIELKKENLSLVERLKFGIVFYLMNFGGTRFDKFIVLTKGNLKEWKLDNLAVIPNPLPFTTAKKSNLTNKKVLVVGKHSYQKSYDRLLKIWKIVNQKHPDWELEICGTINPHLNLSAIANDLEIVDSVKFTPPVKNIEDKYKEASLYLMTSRFEGFGMVLIEAMSFGVPCISFNCNYGPSDIIKNGEDGFLIENGDVVGFSNTVVELIENETKRKEMGKNAKRNVKRYSPDIVMPIWDTLFRSLLNKE